MRWRPGGFSIFVCGAALACTLGAATVARNGSAGGRAETGRCPDAPGFTCSTLSVPLDRGGRVGGTLALRVAAQDAGGSRGVLVFLSGGPRPPGGPLASPAAAPRGPAADGYRLAELDPRA